MSFFIMWKCVQTGKISYRNEMIALHYYETMEEQVFYYEKIEIKALHFIYFIDYNFIKFSSS